MLRKLTSPEFTEQFGTVHDRVFEYREGQKIWEGPPFRDKSWQVVLITTLHAPHPADAKAIVAAARAMGDEEAVVTDSEASPRHRYPVLFTLAPEGVREASRSGGILRHCHPRP